MLTFPGNKSCLLAVFWSDQHGSGDCGGDPSQGLPAGSAPAARKGRSPDPFQVLSPTPGTVTHSRRPSFRKAAALPARRLPGDLQAPTPETLGEGVPVSFDEPAYELGPGAQGEFDSPILRIVFDSLKTPPTTIDINLETGSRCGTGGGGRGEQEQCRPGGRSPAKNSGTWRVEGRCRRTTPTR